MSPVLEYVMLCNVMICYAWKICYVMVRYVMQCCDKLCHFMLRYINITVCGMLCYVLLMTRYVYGMLCYDMLCYVMACVLYVTLCYGYV